MLRLVVAIAAAALAPPEVEKDGVSVRVHVEASLYTYEVTNLSASSITSFEVQQYNAYNFEAPDGWEFEKQGAFFRAEAVGTLAAIGPQQTETFSLYISSEGAVLGQVEVRMGLASGDSVIMTDVWGGVPEPRATRLLVSFMVAAVFLFHAWVLAYRDHRTARCATDGP